jgi:nucleotide-binding universal stress UspA family protein
MIALHNILVATDFGQAAGAALTYGRALAQTFGARLHVLHALENSFLRGRSGDPHAQQDAILQRLHEHLTADDRTTLAAHVALETSDDPAEAITQYAKSANIDLIVIGTNGRGALAQLLVGSVAERVVRIAPCPVLTVRHPEREFVMPDASIERSVVGRPKGDAALVAVTQAER